jgi:hypothetical protein
VSELEIDEDYIDEPNSARQEFTLANGDVVSVTVTGWSDLVSLLGALQTAGSAENIAAIVAQANRGAIEIVY